MRKRTKGGKEQVSYPLVPRAPLAFDCILLPAKEVTPFDELAFVFVGRGEPVGTSHPIKQAQFIVRVTKTLSEMLTSL